MQTLRIIIRAGEPNGIVLAEKAVDQFAENVSGEPKAMVAQLLYLDEVR